MVVCDAGKVVVVDAGSPSKMGRQDLSLRHGGLASFDQEAPAGSRCMQCFSHL
jgi:hypothetical protein